ncbi:MAG: cupin domain-containing protein [Stellaceae bacterium]
MEGHSMLNPPDALTIEEHFFADDGRVPNNPSLPLIVYRRALETGPRCAADCETLFAHNGWGGAWRNGIYAHHHYHSTAHEVLGIAAGSVRVRLGGEDGTTVELHAGDVVVIPAGVAHKNEGASPDLVVVGAYPGGKSPDMCSPAAQQRERALQNVREVPLPASDPVSGKAGPLTERWSAVNRG